MEHMEQEIKIRPIEEKDNAALAHIIRSTLKEFGANHPGTVYYDETTDRLSTLFNVHGGVYFVAEMNDEILGGGGIFPTAGLPADTCELVKMYLLPQSRGKGLGIALLNKCIDFARGHGYKNIYLESMPELARAVKLYEKMGFKKLNAPMGQSGHFGCGIWMMLDLNGNI
jgi:putative acetyltransferase